MNDAVYLYVNLATIQPHLFYGNYYQRNGHYGRHGWPWKKDSDWILSFVREIKTAF